MTVDFSGNQVRHRLPDIGVNPGIRCRIEICSQHIENMAEAHKTYYIFFIFPDSVPLGGIFVQNKVDMFFLFFGQRFHTVAEKVKTIILGGNTIFFVDQPQTSLLHKRAENPADSPDTQVAEPEKKVVVWSTHTAAEDEAFPGAPHWEDNVPAL